MTRKDLDLTIDTVGNALNLTYPNRQMGTGMGTIYLTTQGKTSLTRSMIKTENPLSIIGINAIQRQDGSAIQPMLNYMYDLVMKRNKRAKTLEPKRKMEKEA